MEKYELLLLIITICMFRVGFKITIDELDVFKLFKFKHLNIIYNSYSKTPQLSKVKGNIDRYNTYRLPIIDLYTNGD